MQPAIIPIRNITIPIGITSKENAGDFPGEGGPGREIPTSRQPK